MTKPQEISDILFKMTRDVCDTGKKSQIAAAITRRGNIVSFGYNNYNKSHPFQKKYSKNESCIFWHAETHAIHNALRNGQDVSGCDLHITRSKTHKTPQKDYLVTGLAKPCRGCMRAIKEHGIANVYYTTETTEIEVMEIV